MEVFDINRIGCLTNDDKVIGGVDAYTLALITACYEHHEIHEGNHYNYSDYVLGAASGAIVEFTITTPDTTKWVHFTFEVYASTGATIELYEGASGITLGAGTEITPRNNNRNSTNTSGVTLYKDPDTITSDGTRDAGFLAGGARTSGAVVRGQEYLLKQNTTYLVRITSLAVSNNISWTADWYESTAKG